MIRKLIILSILLLFPVMLFAKPPEDRIKEKDVVGVKAEVYFQKAKDAGVVEEVSGVVKIKPANWKDVKIKDRIDLRILDEIGTETAQAQKIADKTEDDTTLKEKKGVIVDAEIFTDVQGFAATITPTPIDVLQLVTLSIEQVRGVLAGVNVVDLPKLAILIYDVGYESRELNNTFVSIQESEKLKKVLRSIPSQQYPIVTFDFLELTNDSTDIYFVNCTRWVDIKKMQTDIQAKNYKLIAFMSNSKNNTSIVELGGSVKDYKTEGRENFEIPYMAVKEVRPNVPVGFITVMFPEMETWLSSFTIQPDCWLLFNVPVFGANWTKIKTRWFKDRPVIANLNHHFQYHDYGGQQLGSVEYNETITKLKSLGFSGAIYWR